MATLAPDAHHHIVGAPDGPTVGVAATRPTYEQVFADLAGERVETLHRYDGENCLIDEKGRITRENVWLDYPAITTQLAEPPPNDPTDEHRQQGPAQ